MKKIVIISRDSSYGGGTYTRNMIKFYLMEGHSVDYYGPVDYGIDDTNYHFQKIKIFGLFFVLREPYFIIYSFILFFYIKKKYNVFIFPVRHAALSFSASKKIISIFHITHYGAFKGHILALYYYRFMNIGIIFIHFFSIFIHFFFILFDLFNIFVSNVSIFVNKSDTKKYNKLFIGTKKIFYLPILSSNRFNRIIAPKNNKNIQFLYVGRLDPLKGIDVLCSLLDSNYLFLSNIIGHFTLNILGDGLLKKALNKYHFVKIFGHISYENTSSHFTQADLFLFPSFYESYGLALFEAMSHGIPILTTKVGDYFNDIPFQNLQISELSQFHLKIPTILKNSALLGNQNYNTFHSVKKRDLGLSYNKIIN